MVSNKTYYVRVPATSANLGCGFDVLGLAFDIHNIFSFTIPTDIKDGFPTFTVSYTNFFNETKISNQDIDSVFTNPENPFTKAYYRLFQEYNYPPVMVNIHCTLGVPFSRGLGSSSTAIVGGLYVASKLLEKKYNIIVPQQTIYNIATELEGHPDNVAAAIYGGMILNIQDEDHKIYRYLKLPVQAPIYFAGVVPLLSLSTAKARSVVPKTFERSVIAFHSSRVTTLLYLLAKEQWDNEDRALFKISIQDKIHQNYRAPLIPGMLQTFQSWYRQGALGVYLSGAGSTLMGIWHKDTDPKTLNLTSELMNHGIQAVSFEPQFNISGTTVTY